MKKSVIIALGILVLLFILSLNAGFLRGRKGGDELSMDKAQEMKKGWLGGLDDLMGPFRPSFDLRRIDPAPECRKGKGTFELNKEQRECDISIRDTIDGRPVEEAENLGLTVNANGKDVTVTVAYISEEGEDVSERGTGRLRSKVRPVRVTADIGRKPLLKPPGGKPPGGGPPGSPSPLEVVVAYFPDGKKKKTNATYRAEGEVRLRVLPEGGLITLQCRGCDDQPGKSVKIQMK